MNEVHHPIVPTSGQNQIMPFEAIRQLDDSGREYWKARDLAGILDYARWENFEPVVKKAMTACKTNGIGTSEHFLQTQEMVTLGSGARRAVKNYKLSRYACYLIVQNGEPSKPVIAAGQTYFAIQTRRQELADKAEAKTAGLLEQVKANRAFAEMLIDLVPGAQPHLVAAKAIETISETSGYDFSAYRLAIPLPKDAEVGSLNATALGRRLGLSAKSVNEALHRLGFIDPNARGEWELTEAGKRYGDAIPYSNHGHSGFQILWRESVLHALKPDKAA